ncbi:MAG: hypothetical protein J7551_04495 [Chloroflexi bacterium]|jgi:hypothetical protein|nr:hypothetical protein [Chloroflexota bacterium]
MAADHTEIFELLGVEVGALTIQRVEISLWGTEVQLDCAYEGRPFQILFEDVRSLQWDVRGHPDERDEHAELIGIFLGERDHRASAIIVTDVCEIAILYGDMMILKEW